MPQPGDLILVHMLEPQAVGSYFSRERWPLHITLMPWFGAPATLRSQLHVGLNQVAQSQPAEQVVIGDQALFGPNQDVPVELLTEPGALQPLHEALLSLVQLLQLPLVNPQWTGENYRPHIARYNGQHVDAGDAFTVADMYLVELQRDSSCQILTRLELKGLNG
ncbi:MAG TPA: 2'-5' RNA ligase family protein [Candidatus Saccharimonadales bacterium]|nr:2'-5' RNA ligase family protein [Candidatus Saccharimonadales bacterium]